MTQHLQATVISIPIVLWLIGVTRNPKSLKQQTCNYKKHRVKK